MQQAIAAIRELRAELNADEQALELMQGKSVEQVRALIERMYKQHRRTGEIQALRLADSMLDMLNARLRVAAVGARP